MRGKCKREAIGIAKSRRRCWDGLVATLHSMSASRILPQSKATNLLITVEALRANPAYARARQKHEQALAHAEKVIKTIKEEGFWDGRIHNSKTHEN